MKKHKKAQSIIRGNPIFVYEKDGKKTRYNSIKQAAQVLGLKRSGIYNCLNGKTYTHHGLSFELAKKVVE